MSLPHNTHLALRPEWRGRPYDISAGGAEVLLETGPTLVADAEGLVHGGFVFSAADHAAMLAINEPFVVLGAAESRFLAPVRAGERVLVRAAVTENKGKRSLVRVDAWVLPEGPLPAVGSPDPGRKVFEGVFTTFLLPAHVLSAR